MLKPIPVQPHVFPNIEDWPIYKLLDERDDFVKEVTDFTKEKLANKPNQIATDMIAQTIYKERIRIKDNRWKVDPPNETLFWKKMRKRLLKGGLDANNKNTKWVNEQILQDIINRYAEEIVGTFKVSTFKFSRKFLTLFFNRLLNTAAGRNFGRFYGAKRKVSERLKSYGPIDKIHALMKKGTVVLAPTHFSSLDAALLGYTLDTVLGLPSFMYGAELRLYNSGSIAYLLNRLGAYRVDKRKQNPIYQETLRDVSSLALQHGVNSLVFPKNTRSRSGALPTRLESSLLGTTLEAQRALYSAGKDEKIFIVPVVLGYPFVLEAEFMIEQYLKSTGKELYLNSKDQSSSPWKIFQFLWKAFSQSSDIFLSFGQPIDVLGNIVNEEGQSLDKRGNKIDVKDYFISDGKVKSDLQREAEYTQILADSIVKQYHTENIILTSHLMAFVVFTILKKQNPDLDIYGLLRLSVSEYEFDYEVVKHGLKTLREQLLIMEGNGELKLSSDVKGDIDELINSGINNVGIYHIRKPLAFNKKGNIISKDFKTLYYYHNRLSTYPIAQYVRLKGEQHSFASRLLDDVEEDS